MLGKVQVGCQGKCSWLLLDPQLPTVPPLYVPSRRTVFSMSGLQSITMGKVLSKAVNRKSKEKNNIDTKKVCNQKKVE